VAPQVGHGFAEAAIGFHEALVELLRQLMEKQAMRRIEAGSLSGEEIERLGRGLMDAEATIHTMQRQFGIDDLNLDLGPVGNLLDA